MKETELQQQENTKKILGLTWVEIVSILVGVSVAEMTQSYFHLKGILSFVIYCLTWFLGVTLCIFMITLIKKWTGKN